MKVTFLGTGTSHGIPMIGCECAVCCSRDSKNKRRRCSLYVVVNDTHLVFDTPPDFRDQVLRFGVKQLDAVFITHTHADHVFGFDDVRRFSCMQQSHIPVYGAPNAMENMRIKFDYVDRPSHSFGGVPRVCFNELVEPVVVNDITIAPLPVEHGSEIIYGYLVEANGKRIGYVPDCSGIPEATMARLKKMDLMILDGLQPNPHSTHFSISEAVEALVAIKAKQSFITHLTHHSDHRTLQQELGEEVLVPWDGLVLNL